MHWLLSWALSARVKQVYCRPFWAKWPRWMDGWASMEPLPMYRKQLGSWMQRWSKISSSAKRSTRSCTTKWLKPVLWDRTSVRQIDPVIWPVLYTFHFRYSTAARWNRDWRKSEQRRCRCIRTLLCLSRVSIFLVDNGSESLSPAHCTARQIFIYSMIRCLLSMLM